MFDFKMKNNSIINIFKEEHHGAGGLYFIVTNIICALITTMVMALSFDSQVIAMADNLAYIVSINTSVYNYLSQENNYEKSNPSIEKGDGMYYYPLNDFNSMLKSTGLTNSNNAVSTVTVTWDGTYSTLQFGSFKNMMGRDITPHKQTSTILSK